MEDKGSALGHGEKNWVKPNMRLFTKTYKLKAVDCLNLPRGAGLHSFSDTMGDGLDEQDKELQTALGKKSEVGQLRVDKTGYA